MRRTTTLTLTLALAFAGSAWSAEKQEKPKLDIRKSAIETPVKQTLAQRAAAAARFAPKDQIEQPTERVVAGSADGFENPKVEPGKVRWHADFAAARAAAERSGKPVLLFQMMGQLDQRFC